MPDEDIIMTVPRSTPDASRDDPWGMPVITPDVVATADGSLAARLRAKREQLQSRTKRFAVPPVDVWEGDLVLIAKPCEIRQNMTNPQVIVECTRELQIRGESGEFEVVPDAWEGLGRLMGVVPEQSDPDPRRRPSVGDIILAVCSSKEIVAAFADQLVGFTIGRRGQIEQALGE